MTQSDQGEHIVLLIHGIRTDAPWAEMVAAILEQDSSISRAIPVGYGFFDIAKFLIPGPWRQGPIHSIARELNEISIKHPTAHISVLAHSFGTYAVTQALHQSPHLQVKRLCLCGSIVSHNFSWSRISSQVSEIINDVGTKDVWPIMASMCSSAYGATGRIGCRTAYVRDRYHPLGHSDFFSNEFATTYWRPFFSRGEIVRPPGEAESPRPAIPPWISPLLAVKMGSIVLLAALILGVSLLRNHLSPDTRSAHEQDRDSARKPLSTHPNWESLEYIEPGVSRNFISEKFGSPIVELDIPASCVETPSTIHYARWNISEDVTIQALFHNRTAIAITFRNYGVKPVPIPLLDLSLGETKLSDMQDGRITTIDDGRHPHIIEKNYFGAEGKYYDFYFSSDPLYSNVDGVPITYSEMEEFRDAKRPTAVERRRKWRETLIPNAITATDSDYDCILGTNRELEMDELIKEVTGQPPSWSEDTIKSALFY